MAQLLDPPWLTLFLDNGDPAAGYWVFFYEAGTSTKRDTFSDSALTTPNTNPVVLDGAGRARVFLTPAVGYKCVLAPPTVDPPTSPIFSQDNIIAAASSDVASNTVTDIVATFGENVSARDSVYMSQGTGGTTAGRWYKTDANLSYASLETRNRGFAVATTSAGNLGTVRLIGKMEGFAALSVGSIYYVSTTPGGITTARPTRAVRVGQAEALTVLNIAPSSGDMNAENQGNSINTVNLVANGDLRQWNEPATGGPMLWTFAGAGGSITRAGSGEADTTTFGAGRYTALITRAGTDCTLTQTVLDATRYAYMSRIGSGVLKRVTLTALGQTSVASSLRLFIDNGSSNVSAFHTGGGSIEVLQVSAVMSAATKLDIGASVLVNGTAYVGGFVLVQSDVPALDWQAGPDILFRDRVVYSAVSDVGNVGGGTDTLHSVDLTPDTIRATGDLLHVSAAFTTANNANAKTLTFQWSGATIVTANLVVNSAAAAVADINIISTGSNTQYIWGWIAHGAAAPLTFCGQATGAATETGVITTRFQGAATADNDIVEKNILITRMSAGRNLG